ncbi:MAG: hypothetical protein Q7T41_01820, partial [Candidatus Saccharibacteria bacterium]|nr:hypothetical protein [Candidatus Saccharibacteria bacterium]
MSTLLHNTAHSTIRGLGEAVTQVTGVLTTIDQLSDYTYPDAVELRKEILRELQVLTGVLTVVNGRLATESEQHS